MIEQEETEITESDDAPFPLLAPVQKSAEWIDNSPNDCISISHLAPLRELLVYLLDDGILTAMVRM